MQKTRPEAAEVFRQFAWNLAGSLALPKPRRRPEAKPMLRGEKK